MKYGSRSDIVSQILEAASDKAHLSYRQLKKCLLVLVERICSNLKRECRHTTRSKNLQLLKIYSQIGASVCLYDTTAEK